MKKYILELDHSLCLFNSTATFLFQLEWTFHRKCRWCSTLPSLWGKRHNIDCGSKGHVTLSSRPSHATKTTFPEYMYIYIYIYMYTTLWPLWPHDAETKYLFYDHLLTRNIDSYLSYQNIYFGVHLSQIDISQFMRTLNISYFHCCHRLKRLIFSHRVKLIAE